MPINNPTNPMPPTARANACGDEPTAEMVVDWLIRNGTGAGGFYSYAYLEKVLTVSDERTKRSTAGALGRIATRTMADSTLL